MEAPQKIPKVRPNVRIDIFVVFYCILNN